MSHKKIGTEKKKTFLRKEKNAQKVELSHTYSQKKKNKMATQHASTTTTTSCTPFPSSSSRDTFATREELEAENRDLRAALQRHPDLLRELYRTRALQALKSTVMFMGASEEELEPLVGAMELVEFRAGDMLVRQDCDLRDEAYIIYSGEVRRWISEQGRKHLASTFCSRSVGLLHLYNRAERSRFNAECATNVVAFRLKKEDIDKAIERHPHLAHSIIKDLSFYIRQSSKSLSTPLLEQRGYRSSLTVVSLAASVESFYRSFMNALINRAVTGQSCPFFPNMHIQVPVRVIYINGMKQCRSYFDNQQQGLLGNPNAWLYQLMYAMMPGLVMCPFSSVLEASNATNNTEPMTWRWTRGYAPRMAREVLFAIGMNQAADFFTERWGSVITQSDGLRGAMGNVSAGLCAGYLSHLPHNLSTKKLYAPTRSYQELFEELWRRDVARVPTWCPAPMVDMAAKAITVLFPVGVVRRSMQICGTFMIINGIGFALRDKNWP